MRRSTLASVFLLALGCGGGQTDVEVAQPAAEPDPADAPGTAGPEDQTEPSPELAAAGPIEEPIAEGEPPPPGSLAGLLSYGFEGREYARPMPSPREAVAGCPPFRGRGQPGPEWYERCELRETIVRTPTSWLVLQIDWEEGGAGEVHLVEGGPAGRSERLSGPLTPSRVEALRSTLGADGLHALDDAIGRVVPMTFSLGTFHPVAELEDSEWLLWVETTTDLDDPEWVLWLVSPDGETRRQLGRRRAELGPCDGGGYWCETTRAECDAAGLRAEGRLCVLPLGLKRVAIHGGELALIGSVMVAGHGGMPGLTWFVDLPER